MSLLTARGKPGKLGAVGINQIMRAVKMKLIPAKAHAAMTRLAKSLPCLDNPADIEKPPRKHTET
jgi:hypothetical protein